MDNCGQEFKDILLSFCYLHQILFLSEEKVKYRKRVHNNVSGSGEDKMVRVPKDMYDAIGEIIKTYPQYGWKGPSEFVRDAIRRYVEELHQREVVLRKALKIMPDRVKVVLQKFMGEEEAEEAYRKIKAIKEEDPEEYVKKVVKVLEEYVGRQLAELIARRIVEERV